MIGLDVHPPILPFPSPGGPATAPASAAPSCHAQSLPWPGSRDPEGSKNAHINILGAGKHQHTVSWGQANRQHILGQGARAYQPTV